MVRTSLKRGFTMIELLVVIVIIGILAGAMVPVIGGFIERAEDEDARNDLRVLGQAAIAYRASNENCYPAAGGYFTNFKRIIGPGQREDRYGRAAGWVYFEHECPRTQGDIAAADEIGDGSGDSYGIGRMDEDENVSGDFVNEVGCCLCYNSQSEEGGLSTNPASWYDNATDDFSLGEAAIMNGALYEYVNNSLEVYKNPAFIRVASAKLKVPKHQIRRAYAMNVIAGTDENLYETNRPNYAGGGPSWVSAIRYGKQQLVPYIDSSKMGNEVMPQQTALFVELDIENSEMSSANSLAGDQVWDWDNGDESIGFIHDRDGVSYAFVCFADGHVEEIRDPSPDSSSPNTSDRLKLSKFYGSGGQNSSGEK